LKGNIELSNESAEPLNVIGEHLILENSNLLEEECKSNQEEIKLIKDLDQVSSQYHQRFTCAFFVQSFLGSFSLVPDWL